MMYRSEFLYRPGEKVPRKFILDGRVAVGTMICGAPTDRLWYNGQLQLISKHCPYWWPDSEVVKWYEKGE